MRGRGSLGRRPPQLLLLEAAGAGSWARSGGRHCAKGAGEGLGREDERGLSVAPGARAPASRRSAEHLLRASPLTPPPLHTLRVPPDPYPTPHPQLSFFRSSAPHNVPSSDLRESARASRGGGDPGLRGRKGAKGRLDEEAHGGTVRPGALGPGCRTSGLLRSPGASTRIPDGGEGKPGASCCGRRFVPRPRRAGPGACEGKESSSQKIPKGAPHDPKEGPAG